VSAPDEPAGPGGRPGSSPDGLPPLRDVIRTYGLSAQKSLGQNFILDLNLTRRIARVAGDPMGLTVVEVGPGPGGLTRALLLEGAGRVIAVERDQRCLPALAEIGARYPGRLLVVPGDALEADLEDLVGAAAGEALIVANLPYAVATTLLVGWLECEPWPPWYRRMALMFQREVAERIVAAPRSKPYGRLSVIAQWRCEARIALTLGPEAFTPPPKVASAVVDLVPRRSPEPRCSVFTLGRVTAAAFGQRRKMLRQSLKPLATEPGPLIAEAGLHGEMRAEEVDVAGFARLAAALDARRAGGPGGPA
jgi:16S rRNA (adenine1518-N6/adenine1519-N6)-dimethyltransferase